MSYASENFTRLLNTCAAHFRQSERQGRAASTTRTLEMAFENGTALANGIAAALMLKSDACPTLRAALNRWSVFDGDTWTESRAKYPFQSVAAIKAAALRDDLKEHPPRPAIPASPWRVERGDYGQGLTLKVMRNAGDCQADVWGHYRPDEADIAAIACAKAKQERP